jgi:hypothetical protein
MSIVCYCEHGCLTPSLKKPRGFYTVEARTEHYRKTHRILPEQTEAIKVEKKTKKTSPVKTPVKPVVKMRKPVVKSPSESSVSSEHPKKDAFNALLKAFGDFNLDDIDELKDSFSSTNVNGEDYEISYVMTVRKIDVGVDNQNVMQEGNEEADEASSIDSKKSRY